jgi:O-antigen ligase
MVSIDNESAGIKLSRLFLMTIPFVMGAACVGGIEIGPLRHTGLMWMASIVMGFILVPLRGNNKIYFPWLLWLPFYAFFGLSLFWTDMDWKFNVQLFIQMLLFPVVGIIASYTIRSIEQLERYNILFAIGTFIIGAACVYYMLGPGRSMQSQAGSNYAGFAERPAATSLIAVAALFLAQIHIIPKTAVFMWLSCFVICLISESRMATLILLMLWIIHPQLASIRLRCAMVGVIIVVGLAAFNTPIIQDRFFKKSSGFSGSGSLEDVAKGKFDSAGRFDAWPTILKKSSDSPWLGHGIGESAPFVYSVWAPMDKPHNEYLKMFYEGGYVGLGSFLIGLFGTLAHISWKLAQDKRRNWANSAAFMGWWGFILIAVVDNPLVYGNNFMQPVFFIIGAANGISSTLHSHASEIEGTRDAVQQDVLTRGRSLRPAMLR